MCFKPTEEEASRARERQEEQQRMGQSEPVSPHPRGNQAPDQDEVDKGLEKLRSIVAQ